MKKHSCYIRTASLMNFSPFQFVDFDALTCLTAFVLFKQSNHLNHSNKNYDWLILGCFTREYRYTLTHFRSFVLKIRANAWGNLRIVYHHYITNKEAFQTMLCCVVRTWEAAARALKKLI